jgi:putative transposase
MKRKRHSPVEIAAKLARADELGRGGQLQSEVAKELGISVMTLHRWRKAAASGERRSPSLAPAQLRDDLREAAEPTGRLAELQLENSRLRRLVTDLLLEKMSLEEAVAARRAA